MISGPAGETGPRAQPHGMEPPNQLPIAANPCPLDCPVSAARVQTPFLRLRDARVTAGHFTRDCSLRSGHTPFSARRSGSLRAASPRTFRPGGGTTARKGARMTTNDPTDRPQPKPRRRHGLGADGIEALRSRQDGKCAICKKPETDAPGGRLAVDHDHAHCPGKIGCPDLRPRSPVRELQQPPPSGSRRSADPAGGHRVPRWSPAIADQGRGPANHRIAPSDAQ